MFLFFLPRELAEGKNSIRWFPMPEDAWSKQQKRKKLLARRPTIPLSTSQSSASSACSALSTVTSSLVSSSTSSVTSSFQPRKSKTQSVSQAEKTEQERAAEAKKNLNALVFDQQPSIPNSVFAAESYFNSQNQVNERHKSSSRPPPSKPKTSSSTTSTSTSNSNTKSNISITYGNRKVTAVSNINKMIMYDSDDSEEEEQKQLLIAAKLAEKKKKRKMSEMASSSTTAISTSNTNTTTVTSGNKNDSFDSYDDDGAEYQRYMAQKASDKESKGAERSNAKSELRFQNFKTPQMGRSSKKESNQSSSSSSQSQSGSQPMSQSNNNNNNNNNNDNNNNNQSSPKKKSAGRKTEAEKEREKLEADKPVLSSWQLSEKKQNDESLFNDDDNNNDNIIENGLTNPNPLGLYPNFVSFLKMGECTPLVLQNDPDEPKNHYEVNAALSRYLLTVQREGVQFMFSKFIEGKGCILGDDMGLGKTIQSIALMLALMGKKGTAEDGKILSANTDKVAAIIKASADKQKAAMLGEEYEEVEGGVPALIKARNSPILVIAPASVVKNWMKEIRQWGHVNAFAIESGMGGASGGSEEIFEYLRLGFAEVVVIGNSLVAREPYLTELKKIKWKVSKINTASASQTT